MTANSSVLSRTGTTSPITTSAILGVALAILHGFLASIYIGHPPLYDEMYHMLAAESWRTSGELRILDGEYLRAPLFTKLVGLSAHVCGTSLECARGISVAASMLLVFLVTAFAGAVMRPTVGFVAGLLLSLNPAMIAASQYIRFYSLHALVFFLFAVIVYILVAHRRRLSIVQTIALGSLAAVMLLFANHLQILSQLGLLAVVLGAVVILAPDMLKWLHQQNLFISLLLVVTVLALTILGLLAVDVAAKVQLLRSGPGWSQGLEHRYGFYHHMIRRWYPALWPMMAILGVLAIARWPRPSLFLLVTFLCIFAVLSIAAAKVERYFVFALPFLIIPMAAGLMTGIHLITSFLEKALKEMIGHRENISKFPAIIVIFVLILGLAQDPLFRNIVRMVTVPGYVTMFGQYDLKADWPSAYKELRRLVTEYPVVLSSSGVKAAYYLGDYSFEVNTSTVLETDSGDEFGVDPRTGRQVISNAASIFRVVHECGASLVIMENVHRAHEETLEALDKLTTRLSLAENMWVWGLNPQDVDWALMDMAPVDAGSLNCRPLPR